MRLNPLQLTLQAGQFRRIGKRGGQDVVQEGGGRLLGLLAEEREGGDWAEEEDL
jgi:hypothetical protein